MLRYLLVACLAGLAQVASAAVPTVLCSSNQTLECTSTEGAVGIVGASIQDAEGDGVLAVWMINGVALSTNIIEAGLTTNAVALYLTNTFSFGTNEVSIGVTDDGSNVVSCTSLVVVQDTTPPLIEVSASPNQLWPPNHRMVPIRLSARVSDICGPVTWEIDQITSNEPDNGTGDGNTVNDAIIAGPHQALLRAERSGNGVGRIYTIRVRATDAAGNEALDTVTVSVPHNRGKGKAKGNGNGVPPVVDDDDDDDDSSDDSGNSKGKGKGKSKGQGQGKGKKH